MDYELNILLIPLLFKYSAFIFYYMLVHQEMKCFKVSHLTQIRHEIYCMIAINSHRETSEGLFQTLIYFYIFCGVTNISTNSIYHDLLVQRIQNTQNNIFGCCNCCSNVKRDFNIKPSLTKHMHTPIHIHTHTLC